MNFANKINLILTIISVIIFILFSIIIMNYFNITFRNNQNEKELVRKAVFEGLFK